MLATCTTSPVFHDLTTINTHTHTGVSCLSFAHIFDVNKISGFINKGL